MQNKVEIVWESKMFLILIVSLLASVCFNEPVSSNNITQTVLRWVDNIEENDMDIEFDRAVIITITIANDPPPSPGLSLGVFISNDTVLTSYNPFRKYINDTRNKALITVSVLRERHITNWSNVTYTLVNYTLICGRQVIPVPEEEDIWHNDKKEHSPLHDLMVLRINTGVVFLKPDPELYSFNQYDKSGTSSKLAGPFLTELANHRHRIGRAGKFASLGFISKTHMKKFVEIRSHKFESDDNVMIDCDGWLPRQWGVFLCVRNIARFRGVGSGALLVYKNKLYGVGCFMLKKGKESILVFTDIRPYYHLINETCSYEDQHLQFRTSTTTSTTSSTLEP